MSVGCQGLGCNQGRTPESCNCWLANRELAEQVERDALHYVGHRIVEWACSIGVVVMVAAIVFGGL